MDTLRFLNLVLPPAPRYYAQLLSFPHGPGSGTNGPSLPAQSLKQLAGIVQVTDAKGWDVYVSMAGFAADATGHFSHQVQSHQCHYVDLDCGPNKPYATLADGVRALATFLKGFPRIPRPLAVVSGNGLHLYWPYTEPVSNAHWLRLAWMLRGVLEQGGLQIDGKCGIDPVRLLRPPGTCNRKDRAHPLKVFVPDVNQHAYQPLNVLVVAGAIISYAQQLGVSTATPARTAAQTDSDLAAGLKEPYSVVEVAKQCGIVGWHTRNGGSPEQGSPGMSQPTWYGVGNLYKHSIEGETRFHADAQQYLPPAGVAGYNAHVAHAMLRKRADHSGILCASLANTDHERGICSRCPHRDHVRSPVVLGTRRTVLEEGVQPATAESTTAAQDNTMGFSNAVPPPGVPPFLLHRNYRHLKSGAAYVTSTDDGRERCFVFCSHVITNAHRLYEGVGISQHAFTFESLDPAVKPDVRRVQVILSSEQQHNGFSLQTALLNHGVVTHSNGRNNFIMGYIHTWADEILRQDNDLLASQMGWQADDSFVLGDRRIQHGEDSTLFLHPKLAQDSAAYRCAGTLEGWQRAVQHLLTHGGTQRQHQFLLGLGIGLASPLLRFTPLFGSVWSFCTGESGRGKTTTGHLASSVWGDPHALTQKAKADSDAYTYNRLVAINSMPVMLDESTCADPNRIADLLINVHAGSAPGRAYANASNRPTLGWRTFVITSTNALISGKLAEDRRDNNGEHARLLEILFDQSADFTEEGRAAALALLENFGWAGVRWMRFVTKFPDLVEETCRRVERGLIAEWSIDLGTERVWLMSFSTVLAGVYLANEGNLFGMRIHYLNFKQYCFNCLQQMRAMYEHRNVPRQNQIMDLLSEIIQTTGITLTSIREAGELAMPDDDAVTALNTRMPFDIAGDRNRMPREIYARYEPAAGLMWVRCKTFNQLAGPNAAMLRAFAVEHRLLENRNVSKRLTSGTELHNIPSKYDCYQFNYNRLSEMVANPGDARASVTELKPAL